MYNFVRLMGWTVVLMYIITASRYFLVRAPLKDMKSLSVFKKISVKNHRRLGIVTGALALLHAVLAISSVSLSVTGSLLFVTLIALVTTGSLVQRKIIDRRFVRLHVLLVILIPVLMLLHVIMPYIFL